METNIPSAGSMPPLGWIYIRIIAVPFLSGLKTSGVSCLAWIKKEKAKVKAKETSGLLQSAAAALQKFVSKGNDLDKLTKKDICAISFRYFGVKLKEVGSKPTLVTSLQELITAQPDVLSSVGPNIAEALLSETPPAFAADDIEDDDAQQDPESGDESD